MIVEGLSVRKKMEKEAEGVGSGYARAREWMVGGVQGQTASKTKSIAE